MPINLKPGRKNPYWLANFHLIKNVLSSYAFYMAIKKVQTYFLEAFAWTILSAYYKVLDDSGTHLWHNLGT